MDFRRKSSVEDIYFSVLIFSITATVTGFEVLIDVNPPAVEFGGAIEMNCSTTCLKPTINVEHKPGVNFIRTKGITWYHDYFRSVQQWDLTPVCSVKCLDPQPKDVKEYVTVYNREISITVLPEVLEINRTYHLECIGPRVYPNNKLILTWLRGSEIVQRDSTGEPGLPDEDKRLRNVFNFIASRSDDGQEYTCLAEVDLGSNTTKSITNSSVTLQTYAFMDQPRILDKRPKEVKQEVTLTCEVSNVYPAEKMRVRWFQDGVELNSDTTRPNSNTVRITAAWTPQESGLMEVVCMADFEKYPSIPPKNNSAFIEVYAFSSPEIQVPTSQEGNLVNITCRVLNVSGYLELRLKKGNDILVNGSSGTGLTISHTVEAQAKLDGQQYICEAELKLQDQSMMSPVIKQQVGTLYVLYKPRDTIMTISVNDKTISGNNKTMSSIPVEVTKGDEITISCKSNGRPSPTLGWVNPSNGSNIEIGPSGFLHIPYVTSEYQGIYKCRATNQYGVDEKEVDLRVKDFTWIVLAIVGAAAILAIFIGMALYYKWRSLKRRQYKLNKRKSNSQKPDGNGHQEEFPLKELGP